MPLETRDLTPDLWPALARLFGPSGACAGCWCMWWRLDPGEHVSVKTGASRKRALRALVDSGVQKGVLAFSDGEPVGWCSYAPRVDLVRLDRSRPFACGDADRVWSLPCFFVKAGWRGKGVSTAMLAHALAAMKRLGVRTIEAYPMRLRPGQRLANAFVYTGTPSLFRAQGFAPVGARTGARQRMRFEIKAARRAARPGAR